MLKQLKRTNYIIINEIINALSKLRGAILRIKWVFSFIHCEFWKILVDWVCSYELYAPEKVVIDHHRMILNALGLLTNQLLKVLIRLPFCIKLLKKFTDVPWLSCLQICFSQVADGSGEAFYAASTKKRNKVVLFHVVDNKTEFESALIMLKVYWCRNRRRSSCFADTVKEEYEGGKLL
jgi:hypothetical protein